MAGKSSWHWAWRKKNWNKPRAIVERRINRKRRLAKNKQKHLLKRSIAMTYRADAEKVNWLSPVYLIIALIIMTVVYRLNMMTEEQREQLQKVMDISGDSGFRKNE